YRACNCADAGDARGRREHSRSADGTIRAAVVAYARHYGDHLAVWHRPEAGLLWQWVSAICGFLEAGCRVWAAVLRDISARRSALGAVHRLNIVEHKLQRLAPDACTSVVLRVPVMTHAV